MSFEVSPSVVSRQVGDEKMLMDLKSGTYFGLDPIGSRVWQSIEDGQDLPALCSALANEFDVSLDQITRDVDALIEQLKAKDLLLTASD